MENDLLERFVQSFQKAVRAEMEAMRTRLGPFEIPLTQGRSVEPTAESGLDEPRSADLFEYAFDVPHPSDKLVPNTECVLRAAGEEWSVTLTRVHQETVQLASAVKISLSDPTPTLVIYPWFLYEKLLLALENLERNPDTYYLDSSWALFGKRSPQRRNQSPQLSHDALNPSQRRAVERCCASELTFVWGPPGTGKTRTLGHIVSELLHQGHRILVTSTTNAAVDQALAQLADLEHARPHFAAGRIVRLGQLSGPTCGASLPEVVERLDNGRLELQRQLTQRRQLLRDKIDRCRQLRTLFDQHPQDSQLTLFTPRVPSLPHLREAIRACFASRYADFFAKQGRSAQERLLARRQDRLEHLCALYASRSQALVRELQHQEAQAVQQARLVLTTMTGVYLNNLLKDERFDTVVVEEAGMAILPSLFYCSALAREKIIAVGDPRQLPPIVQSSALYVRRAMGRSIFSITVPDPLDSELVALLDVQYRMHPVISDLVNHLFYAGQLKTGPIQSDREILARHRPFPGLPLVVVDTQGRTTCIPSGSGSRSNPDSARFCVELAHIARNDNIQSIGIIAPYVEQARLLRQFLATHGEPGTEIECSTVHRFQGHERDLIIFDTVDASPLPPGVLLNSRAPDSSAGNLLNVSISRARGKLILLADVTYFQQQAPHSLVNHLLKQAAARGAVVPMDMRRASG